MTDLQKLSLKIKFVSMQVNHCFHFDVFRFLLRICLVSLGKVTSTVSKYSMKVVLVSEHRFLFERNFFLVYISVNIISLIFLCRWLV